MQEHHDDAIHLPAERRHTHLRHAGPRRPSAASGETPPAAQISPQFVWWVMTKSWRVVVPVGVLLAGVAASALIYSHVPMYPATAIIQIEQNRPFIVSKRGNTGNPIRTQVEMIRQPFVLREALDDKKVQRADHLRGVEHQVGHIQENLSISQVGGSEYFELEYVAPNPNEAEDVLAAVLTEYTKQHDEEKFQRTGFVISQLSELEAAKKKNVERLQQEVVELTAEITGRDPSRNNRVVNVDKAFPTLGNLHGELATLDVEMEILEAEIKAIEASDAVMTNPLEKTNTIDILVDRDPQVRQLKNQIEASEDALEALDDTLVDAASSDDYQDIEEFLAEKREELAEVTVTVREALLQEDETLRKLTGEASINAKRDRLKQLQLRQETLDRRFQEELTDAKVGDTKVVKLQFAKANLDQEMRVLEMIAQRRLVLTTEAKAPALIKVKDVPRGIPVPLESVPWKKLLVACCVALAAPFGLAVLREVSLKRIVDAEQLYGDSNLRVLGEIASFPTRRVAANPQNLPRSLRREMHAFAESIDALRMSLTFHRSPEDSSAAYAITSAVSSEGKTSVSSALAMSFANATRKPTLLIDGDLRDPSIPDLIPLQEGPGLAEVLAGKCAIGEAIQPSPSTENLYVLPAGDCPGSPHALVQPRRLRKLIETLRERFSVIVLDTPPVLGASESLTLCSAADVASVCVMRGSSRLRQLQIASEKLDAAGANLAGAVLNGVPTRGYGYAYAYGYGFRDQQPVEATEA